MICKLCKKNKATFDGICSKCLIDIQMSFGYYIGGKEVTKEEYDRRIDENKI